MEDFLDSISRQEVEHIQYLNAFYFGNGKPGLKQDLKSKEAEIDPRRMSRFLIGTPTAGEHRDEVVLRVGKYGPFLEQGERRASLPDGMCPDELTLTRALELLDESEHGDEPLGVCPATQRPVYLKQGRFGPYVQLGTTDDEEKPKNASLLSGMQVEDVTVEVALKLLSLPRPLGEHPEMKETVEAFNGRYGPYVKCGSETRSLPDEWSPLDVTLEQAIQLLAQPKPRGRGRGAPKEPIKTFDKSPVTNEPVKLLEGRYGPYVTDGTTNASIPRGASPEDVTFANALQLLAERAASAPAKKKKKVVKKKTGNKKVTKKTTKKTTAKTKAAKTTTRSGSARKKATTNKPKTKKTSQTTAESSAVEP